ncbi:MAG: UDP-N-acetylglucosamine--N-acetylmuramyl-(pentapeptide) pyrophosphoryl-undecaprenol [Clostridia bacterium]|jgi:UDP-N-acetylglucosamine--N-acetylmuramyl-(pentapeptide) pyrophosphoryl-undecaprenol N-acetylglucosamine transferase|nr:UDP-N-acetylglucosamine--N-acetylmuramyl-(pentapeptide) pyrophosphoryl-undecaprenol [Clostridiales bacterium]MDK2985628.1 UDP-N-acetylglucosamine--N-acetylmuramyl-(pentapeptide) pyrophosphoryl-undecaprenol [Clostridia bacterium]
MKVILSGGGTGGHIYPALAIGTLLKERYPETKILYVGTANGLEASIVPKEGIDFATVTVEGLPRRLSPKGVKVLLKLLKGSWQSRQILRKFCPDIIVATGGYVCGPISYLAARQGVKLVLHEQNALPGLTNRLLSKKADLICTTFKESIQYFPQAKNVVLTGLPIRQQIIETSRDAGARALGIDPEKFIILVTGGSRGAKRLNDAMLEVIKYFTNKTHFHIIHITGNAGYEDFIRELKNHGIDHEAIGNITIKPYLHGMHYALACANVVVGRAGATFISEITAKGIPAILIPYPYAAENHQHANAMSLVRNGAALIIKDDQLTGQKLLSTLKELLKNNDKLQEMKTKSKMLGKPDAGEKIVNLIESLL